MGLIIFLGSILTFIVASLVTSGGGVGDLVIGRRIIGAGTTFLTLPGLGFLMVSGGALVVMNRDILREPWARAMVIATVGIVGNGLLVVLPAVRSANALAEASMAAGRLVAAYRHAYATESIAGAVNVALALLAMAAGVWRFGARRETSR